VACATRTGAARRDETHRQWRPQLLLPRATPAAR
jgi:hypothetical protein